MSSLLKVIQRLESARRPLNTSYWIPGLWLGGKETDAVEVDPYEFYLNRLNEIADTEPQYQIQGIGGGEWSRHAIIYNLFPRVTSAFDHDGDGYLAIDGNEDGWRETGTLLKCIALLLYIRNMGFNTVHLLPITTIGQDGRKGSLGSPYAIRNPYKLDHNLEEPALELSADELFGAFVEAAHILGLRVILEFVLRTGSKDSDWIRDHPDWFYWIRADVPDRIGRGTGRLNSFGSPVFPHDVLNHIRHKVESGDRNHLPEPSAQYRSLYTLPPRPDQVYMENGRYYGTLDDATKVRIPGAFADWPPDDNQPPWTDVTYLRMYNHPNFNYMAYNTLRMYDAEYAQPEYENTELWDSIVGVIPHYQQTFGIDGVMIDMGHALPSRLKQRIVSSARDINPDFAFWDENFSITQHSRDEGYNAVMGWWVLSAHEPDGLRNMVNSMAHQALPISSFAAMENHNTPRAASRPGGIAYAHYVLSLAITLPTIPFILSGFELSETHPINTGIGFSNEYASQYPPERLPLFSEYAFGWCRPINMIRSIRYALSLRRRYEDVFLETHPESFVVGYSDNGRILVYTRRKFGRSVSIIANTDQIYEQHGRIVVNNKAMRVPGLWGTAETGMDLYEETMAHVTLSPNYVLILDGSGQLE
jgi:starch synthase (maltosyl-transferring)